MAVHTPVPYESLTRFLQNYALGKVIAFKGVAEGIENSNFLLETQQGRFILTLFEKRVKTSDLPFFIGVMEHLYKAGFPVARPIPDTQGTILQTLQERPALIVSFLNGVSPEHPSADQCYVFGQALAQFHQALQDCPLTRPNDFALASWKHMFVSNRAKIEQFVSGLSDEIATDLEHLQAGWPSLNTLPSGLIHADLFPDNALFLDNKISGFIDFYFACSGFLAYDFAVCLNAWCLGDDGHCDPLRAQGLAQGYQSVRPWLAAEYEALPMLAQGAAMRFFLTRMVDWSPPDHNALLIPKDPQSFLHRLAFHRKAKNHIAYGI